MTPLHPQLQALLAERLAAGVRPVHELTVAEARAADLKEARAHASRREPVARVTDHEVPGPGGSISVRVYAADASRTLPVLVYFFGGGWVFGSIEASDGFCRRLANAARCAVAAVAYRRAPEHRFPAAVEDCWGATAAIAERASGWGLDDRRLAVGGGSAGANLAAVVARVAHDRRGPPLVHQMLLYPVTDRLADTPSKRGNVDLGFFNVADLEWAWSHYLADPAEGADPLASPLRAEDLSGLPDALVITAEHDPVRDEAEAYATRLEVAGVPVRRTRYAGMVHGFAGMVGRLDAAGEAIDEAAAALRERFAASSRRDA
jgi:acetyl esterase